MNFINRLANREFLILVAIIASAITLHVRQQVTDAQARPAQAAQGTYGRICEPPAAKTAEARIMPADCGIRANVRRARASAN